MLIRRLAKPKLVFWRIVTFIYIVALFIIIIACNIANIPIALFHLLIELLRLYNIGFCGQNKAFLRPIILFIIIVVAIVFLFLVGLIDLSCLRLQNSPSCYPGSKLRFFVSKIFLRPKLSLFKLRSTFLKTILIDISGVNTRSKSCFDFGIFCFIDQFCKTI